MKRLWRWLTKWRKRPPTQAMSLLATREGREKLAALIAERYPVGQKPAFDICPACEGYGKLGQRFSIWEGGSTSFLDGPVCEDCKGTGIKGGLEYENVTCPDCNRVGCGSCRQTGLIKVPTVTIKKEKDAS